MIFAALIRERDDLRWQDLGAMIDAWLQTVGVYAFLALVIWLIARFFSPPKKTTQIPWPAWQRSLFAISLAGAALAFIALGVCYLPVMLAAIRPEEGQIVRIVQPWGGETVVSTLWRIAGIGSLAALFLGFIGDLARCSLRRIWAITRLSFKEAVRQRVLWIFVFLLGLFMFGGWFIQSKAEDQVRTYVQVVYFVIAVLLFLASSLLISFSIPTDIKNQTIHTVVTKPVERFEIILGRYLGYTLLMTLILFVMAALSLLYVVRGVNQDARQETMRARIPIFGEMSFQSRQEDFQGVSVGREWEYRKYINGTPAPFERSERAVWSFDSLPASLADRPDGWIPCEFSFDIFRTLKGEEGKGVFCSFRFTTRSWDDSKKAAVEQERAALAAAAPAGGKDDRSVDRKIAEKYGIFEIRNKQAADYHTEAVQIPIEIIKNAMQADGPRPRPGEPGRPMLQVAVKCESGGQYLGVAKHDFYILDAEQSFAANFMKGVTGIWMRICLLNGIAVVCSTYLSGTISWLVTMVVYILGYFRDYITQIATGRTEGGGPLEAFYRLVNKENLVTELPNTPTVSFAQYTDVGYRWFFGRVVSLIPDVERFDFSAFVASGFNVSLVNGILITMVLLIGYLIPCFILGYYLIKSREIAS